MREQNTFNAEQAQVSRDWNMEADSTKYQRQVADMQKAGVNPALAMNGGVTTQATSNATASSSNGIPGGLDLSSVMQMALGMRELSMRKKELQIQRDLADADIRVKNAEAEGKNISNTFAKEYYGLRNKGMELSNNLSEKQ